MENQQGKKSEEASPTFFFSASIYPNLSILFRPQESFECVLCLHLFEIWIRNFACNKSRAGAMA